MNNNIWSLVFSFEKLIAPKIQRLIYILGLIFGVIGGLLGILSGIQTLTHNAVYGLGSVVFSIILTALGLLIWRIFCEAWIVYFGIYERLGDIRDATVSKK